MAEAMLTARRDIRVCISVRSDGDRLHASCTAVGRRARGDAGAESAQLMGAKWLSERAHLGMQRRHGGTDALQAGGALRLDARAVRVRGSELGVQPRDSQDVLLDRSRHTRRDRRLRTRHHRLLLLLHLRLHHPSRGLQILNPRMYPQCTRV